MSDVIHTENIEHMGYTFRVEHVADHDHGAPWEMEDGHGVVSNWTTRDKYPGELVLNSDRSSKRFYDLAETCRIALRDGWGARGAKDGMTSRQIAACAAREDYERLLAWCNDEWHYVGVVVTLLDIEGNETDAQQSVWGVESDAVGYLGEVAHELAIACITDTQLRLSHAEREIPQTIYTSGSRSWIVQEASA